MYEEVKRLIHRGYNRDIKYLTVHKTPHTDELALINKVAPIMPGNYLSVGGTGGAGKSSYVNHYFVFSLYKKWKAQGGIKPTWLYYFTERDPRIQLISKFICWLMYIDYREVIDVPTLLQWPNRTRALTEKDLQLVEALEPQVRELESMITIHSYVMKDGKRKPIQFEDIVKLDEEYQREKGAMLIRILDHVNNVKQEGMSDIKTLIETSDHSKWVRDNRKGWLIIDLNQFNRETTDTNRQLKMQLRVRRNDWYGSDKFYQNTDWMLGILDPSDFEVNKLFGYRVDDLRTAKGGCRLRGAWLVKNSYGDKGASIPLMFQGEGGIYLEVPPLKEGDELAMKEIEELKNGNIYFLNH